MVPLTRARVAVATSVSEAQTYRAITPTLIQDVLTQLSKKPCIENTYPEFLKAANEHRINVCIKDLLELGSAVVKEVVSALSPGVHDPSFHNSSSLAISRFIYEILDGKLGQSVPMTLQGSAIDRTEAIDHSVTLPLHSTISTCEKKLVKDEISSEDDGLCQGQRKRGRMNGAVALPPGESLASHERKRITKNVPPHILYSRKGVRCQICWLLIKGADAVDDLVRHTEELHPESASRSRIMQIRSANAFDKLIGKGIGYCTCEYCIVFGGARFHNGYKRRRHC